MPDTPAPPPSSVAALEELRAHEHGDELARLVHAVAFAAADERRTSLADGVGEAAEHLGISADEAETSYGNVVRVLEGAVGVEIGSASRMLLSAALARGVALSAPEDADAVDRIAELLLWLAAHTAADAFPALDEALDGAEGEPVAPKLWRAVGAIALRIEEGKLGHLGRAGALVAAAAISQSTSEAAAELRAELSDTSRDPVVRALLAPRRSPDEGEPPDDEERAPAAQEDAVAEGELIPPPRGPLALALMAVTGILLVLALARAAARWLLRLRRHAEIRVTAEGVTVESRTVMFGRTLREQRVHIPIDGLARVMREVRYPRVASYVGIGALVVGSYLGIRFFIDGARSGSPELLGFGVLLVLVGLGLDYALSNLLSGARGRCRLLLVPRKGRSLAIAEVDPRLADAALSRLIR